MKIGELSAATGVSVRLLRYYEEQELLTPVRTPGGHRSYGPEAPLAVRRIRALLDAGLPTRVIREVLPCVEGDGLFVHPCVSDRLREQLRGMEERIAELEENRAGLAAILAVTEAAVG
ncbi:MerR family transcriptional regulator [Streptomyces mobaraensis NBRC 13819 = DSM 40847]|uniref:MerR family transcriptional regulator n=2 Tax=Streptomyces mobaraensis TaxID=35621 RepID=A0A5N5VX65_STRMB|nr:MerR family transcriptional regulator [Streptomyces mobaraensis]EMF02266.1 MerR family transcriptional regulator [Streptomyces mobaraensis NBRC 13819 = DSM 40847]KAB7833079.1 MerR family transcriptional regulator [Streptomyces mobaraensis]QTT73523.1 MerR family transcriptional regulator [Streptomyces mobaraensis NBRC 13819 = DSM 40847]